jgi:hypothetical protein
MYRFQGHFSGKLHAAPNEPSKPRSNPLSHCVTVCHLLHPPHIMNRRFQWQISSTSLELTLVIVQFLIVWLQQVTKVFTCSINPHWSKVKVKLSQSKPWRHRWEERYNSSHSESRHHIGVSGQLHASASLPLERNPGTHWTGGCVDSITDLDELEKRKISCPCWDFIPGSTSP